MHRTYSPDGVPAPVGGYVHALEAGPGARWLHISGQIPETPSGDVPATFGAQCELVWDHIERALAAAGMTWAHLVHVRTYLTSRDFADENGAIRRRRLGSVRPALTVVVAGTLDPRWLLEIEAVAAG